MEKKNNNQPPTYDVPSSGKPLADVSCQIFTPT